MFYEFFDLYDNLITGDTKRKLSSLISQYNYYSDQVFMKKKLLNLSEDDLVEIHQQATELKKSKLTELAFFDNLD